jgi:phosphoserine phosphatase
VRKVPWGELSSAYFLSTRGSLRQKSGLDERVGPQLLAVGLGLRVAGRAWDETGKQEIIQQFIASDLVYLTNTYSTCYMPDAILHTYNTAKR